MSSAAVSAVCVTIQARGLVGVLVVVELMVDFLTQGGKILIFRVSLVCLFLLVILVLGLPGSLLAQSRSMWWG